MRSLLQAHRRAHAYRVLFGTGGRVRHALRIKLNNITGLRLGL